MAIESFILLLNRVFYASISLHDIVNMSPVVDEDFYTQYLHHEDEALYSQKRHKLDASCGFYRPDAICQQVVSSLLTSSSCIKSVNIRLAAT